MKSATSPIAHGVRLAYVVVQRVSRIVRSMTSTTIDIQLCPSITRSFHHLQEQVTQLRREVKFQS